ncbi:MAG: alkylation response protein AidB-like acyl-CoA dehydrogenase [Myxococcota bacterium]|jgi:alkylation response protein AidB-like acyl-CoA dehydrogenase
MKIGQDVLDTASRHSEKTETLRHLHPEVFSALVESGVMRGWAAEAYGGGQATVREMLTAIEDVSRHDGSAGWCVMIANTTALTSFHLPSDWGQTIYGDPASCTGGFAMPTGVATWVDGGLEVNARWSWGSGTNHSTWIGGGARIVDANGEPATTPDGATAPFVFFEPNQVELLDTWHVSGLKGTASTDYSVTKAFVPEGRWVQITAKKLTVDCTLARFPFFGALAAGIAAVTIGLAERAIDELIKQAGKRSLGSSKSLAERTATQADLSLAMANVAQARSFLYESVERAWEAIADDGEASEDARATLRLAASSAAMRCVEAVDLCYNAAGSAAIFQSSPLQRVFRDVHVAITHGMITGKTLEPLGRLKFGLPTSTALF